MSKQTKIDASGLACPQPVILAKKALQEFDQVIVTVDNTTAVENVTRLAESMKCAVKKTDKPDGKFELHITRTGAFDPQPVTDNILYNIPAAAQTGPNVFIFSSNIMGKGNDELGALLMKSFIHTTVELDSRPDILIFYNTGVKLTVKGSDVIEDLKKLESMGIKILVCGTCLNFFNLKDDLQAGIVSNMYDIAGALSSAGRIVQP